MYVPEHFAEPDVAVARALIEAHSFGTLIVPADPAPVEHFSTVIRLI